MRSRYSRLISSGVLAVLLAVTTSLAQAGKGPLPSTSNAFGKGYAELTTDWVKWVIAIPTPSNPLLDPTGAFADVGQSGKVWFLAGTFDPTPVTRSITVPAGTALFFPIINEFWVNIPEAGDNPWSPAQEAFVRDFLAEIVDNAENLVLTIDGKVENFYRFSGPEDQCTLPDDNIFGAPVIDGPHECLSDGYWALLPPLSNGQHTIHFEGSLPDLAFSLNVTYNITVTGH